MKTISNLLVLSLLAAPVAGCDLLPEKNDGTDDDWTQEARDDEDDREDELDEGEGASVGSEEHDGDDDDDAVEVDPSGGIHAFAIRHGDLPSVDVGGDSGGDGGGGDSGIDPDSLLVVITNGVATCSDPFAANECGGYWSVSFTLSPEMQGPGAYSLWEELSGGFSVTGEPYDEGDCAWGGGTLEGMVELTIVDETTIHGEIFDAEAWEFDANVLFEADLCQ